MDFGLNELRVAGKLLSLLGTDKDHTIRLKKNITPEYNRDSGLVFLVDESFHVAMVNGECLEDWYVCPECYAEGFLKEFKMNQSKCCQGVVAPCQN